MNFNCNLQDFKSKVNNAPQPIILKSYVLGWMDKCFQKGEGKSSSKKTKTKRAPSAYNQFIGECMKGCGNNTEPCSDRMKGCAIKWKQKKK